MRVFEACPRRHVSGVRTTDYYYGTLFQILLLFLRFNEISKISERLIDVQVLQVLRANVPKFVSCNRLKKIDSKLKI